MDRDWLLLQMPHPPAPSPASWPTSVLRASPGSHHCHAISQGSAPKLTAESLLQQRLAAGPLKWG